MEELSKVAEIISSLGEQGKSAFMWYLGYQLIIKMVAAVLWGSLLGCAYLSLKHIAINFSIAHRVAKAMKDKGYNSYSFSGSEPCATKMTRIVNDNLKRPK